MCGSAFGLQSEFNEHIDFVYQEFNKFCGLVFRVGHLYLRKRLHKLNNSIAKSIISYGLPIYGTAAESNLKKIDQA